MLKQLRNNHSVKVLSQIRPCCIFECYLSNSSWRLWEI